MDAAWLKGDVWLAVADDLSPDRGLIRLKFVLGLFLLGLLRLTVGSKPRTEVKEECCCGPPVPLLEPGIVARVGLRCSKEVVGWLGRTERSMLMTRFQLSLENEFVSRHSYTRRWLSVEIDASLRLVSDGLKPMSRIVRFESARIVCWYHPPGDRPAFCFVVFALAPVWFSFPFD